MKKKTDRDELLLLALVEMLIQYPNKKLSDVAGGSSHVNWFLWYKPEQGYLFWSDIYYDQPLLTY